VSSSRRSGDRDDVLNGIAFDDQTGRLVVTGKRWPFMFDIATD
jgi:glutamine cyclotransferase